MSLEVVALEQQQQTCKELFVVVEDAKQVSRVSMGKILPGQAMLRLGYMRLTVNMYFITGCSRSLS